MAPCHCPAPTLRRFSDLAAAPQKPITFFRQVLSLCEYPELMSHPAAADIYPPDAVAVGAPPRQQSRDLQQSVAGSRIYLPRCWHPLLRRVLCTAELLRRHPGSLTTVGPAARLAGCRRAHMCVRLAWAM